MDLSPIQNFFSLPTDIIIARSLYYFGWIPIAAVVLWGFKKIWINYIQKQWAKTQNFIILAIDIPRGNTQTPKAVENIFTYLAGAHQTFNLIDKYWIGKFQLSFSLEIVSIEGYTQFLIRTPEDFRNLVESAIYSQYPDAEITEVDDYTEKMPRHFPDDEYDIWGAEFIQANSPAYPIKTYKEFEYPLGKPEEQYKDPMASLMDLGSSLDKGEQLWFQIILIPTGFDWPEIGDKEISRILGEKIQGGDNIFTKIIDEIIFLISELSEMVFKLWGDIEDDKQTKNEENQFKMMNLKPKEKKQAEAITEKTSKLGFEAKMRMVYMAKKEVMNKPKVVNGFVGFIKQFVSMDLNNIKPDMDLTGTKANYFFQDYRINYKKNKIINNYINRDSWAGKMRGLYNIEELASIWHFPVEAVVKAPLVQKAPGRKAEPPMSLPSVEQRRENFFRTGGPSNLENIFSDDEDKTRKTEESVPLNSTAAKRGNKEFSLLNNPAAEEMSKLKEENIFSLEDESHKKEKNFTKPEESKGAPPSNLPVG